MYKHRILQDFLIEKNPVFGAILITGPRRAGKTTLSKKLLELWGYNNIDGRYVSFDTPDIVDRFQSDPVIFMQNLKTPCVLDEVQNAPDIFKYIKADLDKTFGKKIKYILTGSQQFNMMKGVSESLAGRILIKELAAFTQSEIYETSASTLRNRFEVILNEPKQISFESKSSYSLNTRMLNGGFPSLQEFKTFAEKKGWINSYIQTYVQRDIRQLSQIQDLGLFNRFITLIAGRSSKIINYSELGKELGMSYKTAQNYVGLLEAGFLWQSLHPYYRNTEKRVSKRSKGILMDSALICYLTGVFNEDSLELSPHLGNIVESFAISELIKLNQNLDLNAQLYFFDQASSYEVDLILELNSKLYLFEFKHSGTFQSKFLEGFKKFKAAYPKVKVSGSFLVSQNPEIHLVDKDTWTLPFNYFW